MKHEFTARFVRWWLPWVAALSVAVAAVFIRQALVAREREQVARLTDSETINIKDNLSARVDGHFQSLMRMAGQLEFWSMTLQPDLAGAIEEQWSRDAELHAKQHPGYQGIAWIGRSHDVWRISPSAANGMQVDQQIAEHPSVRQAIERAQQTRKATVSRPIDLSSDEKSIVICAPLFPNDEFAGCVVGIFDLKVLLDSIFRDNLARGYGVAVADASQAEIYVNGDASPRGLELTQRASVALDGVPWTIRVWPTEQRIDREHTVLPDVTLAAGLLMALLLGAALFEFQKARVWGRRIEHAHDELERAEQRHRLTLEMCLDAVVTIDEGGIVREWNRQAENIFGWPQDEVVGRRLRDVIVPPESREAHQQGIARFLQTGEGPLLNRRIEVEALRKSGERFPVELTITPIEIAGGWLFTAFVRDITERKRAEAELLSINETLEHRVAERTSELRATLKDLTRAKEAAEGANRAKSAFLANMSHEIRTPLNAVIGMTELVLDGSLNAQQREYLGMIQASGESLLTVINDILDFSKIEAGRMELEGVSFNHAELLGDTMKSLGVRAASKGLELICRIAPDVPAVLTGDAGRLRQVLNNLVGNAVKFTARGEVVVDVSLDSSTDESVTAHYIVHDTGIGIPEGKLGKMFEAFEQADVSTTRRFGGTGLGLAISSRLVEMMDGCLWAESHEGSGSTFHFTARFRVPREQPSATPPAALETIRALPVLIVDDNATNRRLLHDLLDRWGLVPMEADGAVAALHSLRQAQRGGHPYRLAIIDAHMPEIDGFELARRIQLDPRLPETVIMMLSSGDRAGDRGACNDLNIAAHLLKPIKPSELLDTILTSLGEVEASEMTSEAEVHPSEIRPMHVLLAEDSPVNQKLAVALLSKFGHRVEVANNGHEAIDLWKQGDYDLVLMDVQMPEMDGLEATQSIRALEQPLGVRTPIIAMTAHALKGDRERCLEAGMDDYVAKPIRRQLLFDAILHVLGLKEQAAQKLAAEGDASDAPSNGLIDWPAALEVAFGDPELLKDLAGACLHESEELLIKMQTAMDQRDAGELLRAAHTIKGHLHILGAAVPEHLAFHIENTARDGGMDVGQPLTQLQKQVAQIQDELREFIAGRISIEQPAAAPREPEES